MTRPVIQQKPIRRSVGFWIGLCVTGFLLWAWVDSRGQLTKFGVRETPRSLLVSVYGSRVELGISRPDASRYTSPPGRFEWVWERSQHAFLGDSGAEEGPWFPPAQVQHLARYNSTRPPGAPPGTYKSELYFEGYEIQIPFIAVILVWVALWLSSLGLYRKRQRKKATKAAGAEDS